MPENDRKKALSYLRELRIRVKALAEIEWDREPMGALREEEKSLQMLMDLIEGRVADI